MVPFFLLKKKSIKLAHSPAAVTSHSTSPSHHSAWLTFFTVFVELLPSFKAKVKHRRTGTTLAMTLQCRCHTCLDHKLPPVTINCLFVVVLVPLHKPQCVSQLLDKHLALVFLIWSLRPIRTKVTTMVQDLFCYCIVLQVEKKELYCCSGIIV